MSARGLGNSSTLNISDMYCRTAGASMLNRSQHALILFSSTARRRGSTAARTRASSPVRPTLPRTCITTQHNTEQQRQLMVYSARWTPTASATSSITTCNGRKQPTNQNSYVRTPPTTLNENIRNATYESEYPNGPYISVQGGI